MSYTATLFIKPHTDTCGLAVLPKVRAILSWQVIPTAGNPNYPVVWGNQLECTIQIRPSWHPITATSPYLCSFGSSEYVAFWADWNDDCNWSYLGTVAINVHDIPAFRQMAFVTQPYFL